MMIIIIINIMLIWHWHPHKWTLLPLVVIIAMVVRTVNTADVHNNITLGQFTAVTCPTQQQISE